MRTLVLVTALLSTGTAYAQSSDGVRIRAGLGAQVQPKFLGSDDYRIAPLPSIDIAKRDDEFDFGAPDDGLSIALIKTGRLALGPSANIASGRKDKDVGLPLGRVKTTVELGGFAEAEVADGVRLRGELRKGLNGHQGLIGSVGVDKVWRDGDQWLLSLGPRVLWSDSKYQRAYFGVSTAAALATGLPPYRPGSGVHALALQGGGLTRFGSGPFGLFAIARYERLVGDAAGSPVVRRLGSRNQFTAGLGLSYTFRVKG